MKNLNSTRFRLCKSNKSELYIKTRLFSIHRHLHLTKVSLNKRTLHWVSHNILQKILPKTINFIDLGEQSLFRKWKKGINPSLVSLPYMTRNTLSLKMLCDGKKCTTYESLPNLRVWGWYDVPVTIFHTLHCKKIGWQVKNVIIPY